MTSGREEPPEKGRTPWPRGWGLNGAQENSRDVAQKAARACTTCKGEGRIVREQHTYKVRTPAGIRDGQEVRIRELGGLGKHGGVPGDLYVTVHITD
ncbi:DnaJ C-terminal domain-containing protein [Streptomyces sp. NPDC004227]